MRAHWWVSSGWFFFFLDLMLGAFTWRMGRHWHRLPCEAVDASSVEVLKARLEGALDGLT